MDYPKISCIMPTANRRAFIPQALKYFLDQDYWNRELIIVDDGQDKVADLIPDVSHIRYIYLTTPLTIGTKRNIACSVAKGEYIAFFDDDDYYGPERLSKQVEPLLRGEAEFSAMRMSRLLDLQDCSLWTCTDDRHRRNFKQDVHYGTLMFPVAYWHAGTHFPSVNVGEDRRFTHALLAQDVRLARIVDPASFAYVLHRKNTTTHMPMDPTDGWQQLPIEDYLSEHDRAFYEQVEGQKV